MNVSATLISCLNFADFQPKRQPRMPSLPFTILRSMANRWNALGAKRAVIQTMHPQLLAKPLAKLVFHLALHTVSKWPVIGIHQLPLIQQHQHHPLQFKANFYKECRVMRMANLPVTNRLGTWGKFITMTIIFSLFSRWINQSNHCRMLVWSFWFFFLIEQFCASACSSSMGVQIPGAWQGVPAQAQIPAAQQIAQGVGSAIPQTAGVVAYPMQQFQVSPQVSDII